MVFIPPKKPMVLPAGFVTPEAARRKPGTQFRRLMIASEGRSDSGKTEFLFSAPGPGAIIPLDRGFDAVLDNPTPPVARRADFMIKPMNIPVLPTMYGNAAGYVPHWMEFYKAAMDTLAVPELRTFCLDADNLSWNLQRLAEWGKLQGVYPATKYADPKAARMNFYFRLWESGKIIICTNMMEDEWRDVLDANGQQIKDDKGEPKREKSGDSVAKGFPDQEYLWQIRIRHLYQPPVIKWNALLKRNITTTPQRWGVRIQKCKANPALIGTELWGERCNFKGLVETVYPHIDPKEWGL